MHHATPVYRNRYRNRKSANGGFLPPGYRDRPRVVNMRAIIALFLMLIAAPAVAQIEPIEGRPVVKDGDSLVFGNREVRLQGIDAPEISQLCDTADGKPWRCGGEAGRALDRIIGGRIVTCTIDPRDPADRYGRALGSCAVGELDLNVAMVRQGHAVAYARYLDYPDGAPRRQKADLLAAEAEAREARRGLWQGRFDRPETWRRARAGRR